MTKYLSMIAFVFSIANIEAPAWAGAGLEMAIKTDKLNDMREIQLKHLAQEPQWIPTLARWFQNEWAYLNPGLDEAIRIQELSEVKPGTQRPITIIATIGDKLLGTYSLVDEDMTTRDHLYSPWLASVYVNPEFRRKGIGELLVQDAMSRAKELGIKRLYLFTPSSASWYEKMGWRTVEVTEYYNKPATVMAIDP